MNDSILTYGNLRLLNIPYAKPVYDEVLGPEDCYRREGIPKGSTVIDIGAFCGEFGLWCAVNKECRVIMVEPSLNHHIISYNKEINLKHFKNEVVIVEGAIGGVDEPRAYSYNWDAPAKSALGEAGDSIVTDCRTLSHLLKLARSNTFTVVKLDCEGAEREIFGDESWLDRVQMVLLEFHNQDGEYYRNILKKHGFTLDTTDANPEAVRAIIYATKL